MSQTSPRLRYAVLALVATLSLATLAWVLAAAVLLFAWGRFAPTA